MAEAQSGPLFLRLTDTTQVWRLLKSRQLFAAHDTTPTLARYVVAGGVGDVVDAPTTLTVIEPDTPSAVAVIVAVPVL